MLEEKRESITIIGSGLAGSFLAVLLAKKGFDVTIYERLSKEDLRSTGTKRSYNIVLFGYGIEILKQTGLWEKIKPHLLALKGSVTHISPKISPVITRTDDKKLPYFTISRALLADILLSHASHYSSVKVIYDTDFLSVDRHKKVMIVRNNRTKKITTVSCNILIGADGANSLVRSFIQREQQTRHRQEYAKWQYKQFILSAGTVKKLGLEKKFVHIWTQKKAFVIAHPDRDDSLTAMLVFPKNNQEKVQLNSDDAIIEFIKENFPELVPALKEIIESVRINPDGNFATIQTDPWHYKGFMAIIGDAAHGFYPFFGQGTSAAFGDCVTLSQLIDTCGADWNKIFSLYQAERKKHTDALGELSKDSLLKNLRYKKADYDAIYDRLQTAAYRLFPNIVYPPLSMTITSDPANAADHKLKYYKQRNFANKFGASLLVLALTKILSLYEEINNQK